MYICKGSLTVRNACSTDAVQLASWWNDGAVMEHAGFPYGLGITAEKIAADLDTDSDDTRRRLIVELENRPIGEMSYQISGKSAEIGIKICDFSEQGKGYGKTLLRMLISELFLRGCEKIVLDTNQKNTRAQHVYETIGFRRTGTAKDAWIDQVGVPQTVVYYELTPQDFRLLSRDNYSSIKTHTYIKEI